MSMSLAENFAASKANSERRRVTTRQSTVADAAKGFVDDDSYYGAVPRRPEDALLHVVEIRLAQSGLDYLLGRIRMWLNQHRAQPTRFRYSFDGPGVVLNVHFPNRTEARALARAFGGEVLTEGVVC
jgi:hypothetical protein